MEFPNFVVKNNNLKNGYSLSLRLKETVDYNNLLVELKLMIRPERPTFELKPTVYISEFTVFSQYYMINVLKFGMFIGWHEHPEPQLECTRYHYKTYILMNLRCFHG